MGNRGHAVITHEGTGFTGYSAYRPVNAARNPLTKETSTIQAADCSCCTFKPALCTSVCPPTAASTLCGREVSLVRQRLVVPHQVTFTGQATPAPAAVPVARYGSNCLLVWKIALGQWKLLYPRGDVPFLWQLAGND